MACLAYAGMVVTACKAPSQEVPSARGGPPPLIAMNAGMYRQDLMPLGLYVERAQRLVALNRRHGDGNFYIQPNGVFSVDATGRADITPTAQWADGPRAMYATQSGPMLVMDGNINPALVDATKSTAIRNGVGLRANGDVVFVISTEAVSLNAFATFFASDLRATKALYLDGAVSALAQGRTLLVGW